jgi:holo-[acyl-carrier protein] synthase
MVISDMTIGTDIVDIRRIDGLIEKFNDVFLQKIFSVAEIEYCQKTVRPACSFAARFAAKEAFAKAIGTGIGSNVGWKDVVIGKGSHGEPYLILSGRAEATMQALGFSSSRVSVSHTKTLAQAVVVLIK